VIGIIYFLKDIYTVDCDIDYLYGKIKAKKDKFDKTGRTKQQQKKIRVLLRIKRDQRKENIKKLKINISDIFTSDKELLIMT
jgi:hypothetical protein